MTSHSFAAKAVRPLRNIGQRLHNGTFLILSIILIIIAVVVINLLVTQAFKPYFKCAFLIGSEGPLNWDNLCSGYTVTVINYSFTILPELRSKIDPSLETFRKFIAWNIIVFFALASFVVAFIVSKIIGFVRIIMTPEGRKVVLTNLSIWLFFFVIFCTLFYFRAVR